MNRSLRDFVLLELGLSIPFRGIGALVQARIVPDHVLFRAAWSLTPISRMERESGRSLSAGGIAGGRRKVRSQLIVNCLPSSQVN